MLVLLQAMKEDPPLDAKCRDKFLVQSVLMTTDDESNNLANFWQTVEKTSKASIQERKIRVNFLPPGGSGSAVNGVAHDHEDEPPAYSSQSPQFGSSSAQTSIAPSSTTVDTAKGSVAKAAENTGAGQASAPVAVANPVLTPSESLQQQLAAANAQISKLTSQLADPQLRQRKTQETSEKMQTVVQHSNESGVPLQIVAGLCLLSFLIAYLFF
jgi:hypothetical protein